MRENMMHHGHILAQKSQSNITQKINQILYVENMREIPRHMPEYGEAIEYPLGGFPYGDTRNLYSHVPRFPEWSYWRYGRDDLEYWFTRIGEKCWAIETGRYQSEWAISIAPVTQAGYEDAMEVYSCTFRSLAMTVSVLTQLKERFPALLTEVVLSS